MLNIRPLKSPQGASQYYSQDNYYTQDQGLNDSLWVGRGAEALGLSGRVDAETFQQLLEGKVASQQLGRRTKDGVEHRAGWDFTFSAPKSASILGEVFGIEAVREAHDQAVKAALAHVEREWLQTRISINGEVERVDTDNAVFATFRHDVSRELDPQTHTHAILVNATHTEKGWRSIANEEFLGRGTKASLEGGMIYRMEYAALLKEQGFSISPDPKDRTLWRIDGVPPEMENIVSKRSSQIRDWFKSNGVEYTPAAAKQVALLTRKGKRSVPRDELVQSWKEQLSGLGLSDKLTQTLDDVAGQDRAGSASGDDGSTIGDSNRAIGEEVPEGRQAARKALKSAVEHLSEKDMGFTEKELMKEGARLGVGDFRYHELREEVERLKRTQALLPAREHPEFAAKGESLWTTRAAKLKEMKLIRLLNEGREDLGALIPASDIRQLIQESDLNEQQLATLEKSLTASHRYFAIQGDPGVGKTRTLRVYKDALEKEGYLVKAFAPSYQATQELGDSLDMPGMVVSRFLVDRRAQDEGKGKKQVWIVDEGGMLTTDQVNRVMELAPKHGARVLFTGDHQQLESVGAGRGFKHLQDAGIDQAVMNKRMRQKTDLMRGVVQDVMAKRYAQVVERMSANNRIVETGDKGAEGIANAFLELSPEDQAETLVVTTTNKQRKEVNSIIRAGLRRQGQLSEAESLVEVFQEVRLSEEEKRAARLYSKGQQVRFNSDYRAEGIKRHTYYTVVGTSPLDNQVALRSPDKEGEILYINPAELGTEREGNLQVFQKETVPLSPGDDVRWLDNSNDHKITRNEEFSILEVGEHSLTVIDSEGRELELPLSDQRNRHFEHYYARTAYGVQGQTSKSVLGLMDSTRRNTVNQRSFMVALTRASHDARLFVDDKKKLVKAFKERRGDNTEALTQGEFMVEVGRHKEELELSQAAQKSSRREGKIRLFKG